MEWLLFTYWLPPEPSRKRVFIWRQLKKIGALSAEGTGWLLPKTEPLLAAITDVMSSVEELEGDLEKIRRWFSEAKKRDFWEVPTQKEAETLINEVATRLAGFVQKTYDELQTSQEGDRPSA